MKIKRCPFCGFKAGASQNEYGVWSVICDNCLAEMVGSASKKQTISLWNRRYKKR